MPFFENSQQLEACMRALFTRIEEQDPGAGDAISASHLVIRLRCIEPAAELTIDGRKHPARTLLGPSAMRPDLDIELAADTLHRIMLGEQSMTKALSNGLLKVRGPVWKAKALVELFRRGQKLYPHVLSEQGLARGSPGA
ncbi:SCP2 sterol-binding domain-containing protein [Chloroflexota bacterium]